MNTIERFEALLAAGTDNEMLRYTLGNAWFEAGDAARAIEHLQAATAFKPDYSAAWKVLGRALAANGEFDAAAGAFDRGMAIAEANGDKQTAKEIGVFRRRLDKARLAAHSPDGAADH